MHAGRRKIDPIHPTLEQAINFLQELCDSGLSCSSIEAARSALSNYLEIDNVPSFGEHKLVKKFMKGVFERKPSLPKLSATWDVNLVLAYLESLYPLSALSLKLLSEKLCTLMALLSGQRCQTIHCITVGSVTVYHNKVVIMISKLIKQSRRNKHLPPIELMAFENPRLCIVHTMNEYLCRTKPMRAINKKRRC